MASKTIKGSGVLRVMEGYVKMIGRYIRQRYVLVRADYVKPWVCQDGGV